MEDPFKLHSSEACSKRYDQTRLRRREWTHQPEKQEERNVGREEGKGREVL